MTNNLVELAEKAKRDLDQGSIKTEHDNEVETPDIVTENTSTDSFIMMGVDDTDDSMDDSMEDTKEFITIPDNGISDELIKECYPDIPEEAFKGFAEKKRSEAITYKKALILHQGFTPEEAEEAMIARFKNRAKQEKIEEIKNEPPKIAVVAIDKTQEKDIKFTEEESKKLATVRTIKLNVIEDQDLKTITVMPVDKQHKVDSLLNLDNSLAKFGVPLLFTGDFVQFKGAQSVTMALAMRDENDTMYDMYKKKVDLIYDRLYGGKILQKYNEFSKIVLDYNTFTNKLKFQDIDICIYAILVASSMQEIENRWTCEMCHNDFSHKTNMKTILDMSDISEEHKSVVNAIIGSKTDTTVMKEISDMMAKAVRVKSDFTNNIYVIEQPSAAKALKLFGSINEKDTTMVYLSTLALYISEIYTYNETNHAYIKVEEDEYSAFMAAMQLIPQSDLDLLAQFIAPKIYQPKFKIRMICPNCGEEIVFEQPIDSFVFQRAQGSSTEIQL